MSLKLELKKSFVDLIISTPAYVVQSYAFDLEAWESKWKAQAITSRIYWVSGQYLHQQRKLFGSLITFNEKIVTRVKLN